VTHSLTTVYPDNWETRGWSRGPDGKWGELGNTANSGPLPERAPIELSVHDVAARLNALETSRKSWKDLALQIRRNVYRLWEQAGSLEDKLADEDGAQ
jgi:hypothetical protein